MSSIPPSSPDTSADAAALTAEVRALQERLRLLSAHTRGLILEFDAGARYVSVWTSDPSLLVRPAEELFGRTVADVLGESEGRPFADRIARVFATGKDESFEYVLDVQDGRRWFSANAALAPGEPGKAPTVTFLVRDVTEQRRLAQQLHRAERLAAVGMLAAGVAHEINNPLGYLMLSVERTRAGLKSLTGRTAEEREQIDGMLDAQRIAWEGADRVRRIVRELTAFARTDAEVEQLVDVERVLDLAIEMALAEMRPRPQVTRDYSGAPLVLASEGCLLSVFANLLANAAQAGSDAGPRAITVRTVAAEQGAAVVEIQDAGEGIAAEALERIFDPFFTTKGPGAGTGLGLSICQSLVGSLGGAISVESKRGVGSTFRVSLPAHRGETEAKLAGDLTSSRRR